MFDEAEVMGDLERPRWPLHPEPRLLERLDTYIRRLAEAYGTGLATFCRYGLHCDAADLDRYANEPTQELLERLSGGTGQSMRRLSSMTVERCRARREVALRWIIRHDPEIVHKGYRQISGQSEFMDSI